MKESIKKRIEAVRRGEVPEGYRRTKDIGIAPSDWRVGQLSDVLHNKQRPVPKPDEPYWRLGIRSWAKGTFHAYVDDPAAVDMDELYVVQENDLVVNITFAWEHAIAVASKEDDGLLVSHRFPTYTFDGGNVPEYYKAVVSQQYFRDMLDHISPGGAGRNRVLNRKDFLALPCHIPPIPEQKKIAEILATCDRAIELKQQLLEEKQRQKRAYLQKMLPQSGCDVPEWRLTGFYLPWQKKKLGELVTFYNGLTYSPDDIRTEGTLVLRSSNVKDGEIVDADNVYVDPAAVNSENVQIGDIIVVVRNGSRALIGKHAEIKADMPNTVIGAFMTGIRSEYPPFVNVLLSTPQFDAEIQKDLGAAINQITGYMFAKMEFMVPEPAERVAIGEFFRAIDNLIALYQRELEQEKQKKKALMQLLLTGLVRVNA